MKYPFEDLEVRDHLLTGVYAVYPDGNHSLHVQIIESDDVIAELSFYRI